MYLEEQAILELIQNTTNATARLTLCVRISCEQ